MTIEYALNENDILQHYLYTESQNEEVKQKRQRVKLIRTLMLIGAGALCLAFGLKIAALALFILAIARWFIFDDFEKKWIHTQFMKRIRANHSEFLGSLIKLTVGPKGITYQTTTNSNQIPFPDLNEVVQVKNAYVFLQMQEGQGIIVPIHSIKDYTSFTDRIAQVCKEQNITHRHI